MPSSSSMSGGDDSLPTISLAGTFATKIENIYTVKVIYKTSRDLPLELKLENLPGTLRVMSPGQFTVPKEKLAQTSVLIDLDSRQLTGPATKLLIGVYSGGKRLETVKMAFVGPR